MGCERICKFCEHADLTRKQNGMIRCLEKHIFVSETSTCGLHSFSFTMNLKELMKAVGKES